MSIPFTLLADIVLIIHALFIAFIVCGALLIILGGLKQWRWVRNPLFRWSHLFGIIFVAAQSWLGMMCPLTTLEIKLRLVAGDSLYTGSFIQYWLQEIIYFTAPTWVFTSAYTTFGFLVLVAWIVLPPRQFGNVAAVLN